MRMLPRETRRHLWASLREQLEAVRSAVDAGARWFDERAREAAEGTAQEAQGQPGEETAER